MESEKVEVVDYTKPEYYTNREMSWLSFDERILSEARDRNIPLFERLKFMSITSSNLDEFYMVRVASLKDMVHSEYTKPDFAGMTPKDQLKNISEKTHKMVELQYRTYNRSILQGLKNVKLRILDYEDKLTQEQTRFIDDYYDEVVYPVLTPMALDSSRPFPLIRNKSLNIGALISKNGKKKKANFATIQVPSVLSRYLEIPRDEDGNRCIVLLENVIKRNIDKIFQGFQVICAYPYRIMRNAELGIDEDDASDLLLEIEKSLKKRQWGEVIRLEADAGMDKDMLAILKKELQIREEDVFMINGPVDLTFLMSMYGLKGFDDQKVEDYTPVDVPCLRNKDDIFTNIRKKDIFLHHPYYSFDPVVDFVTSASVDPDVLAIKQTLYRVSGNSPIVAALERAAMNGKMVTVLVELKARFDEENNIGWARELERAGCHVIYGLVGLKTHSKITLIVRREDDGIRRYVHLGTGNYNDKTAKLYTDCGILTCDKRIGEDASAVFNMITGYSEPDEWNDLIVAPIWMKYSFLQMIKDEENNARAGKKAHIIAKMNALCEPMIMEALYKASAAGVKIDLIVRGICSLKTGIPGVSENITVRSIVGNFLEHARIFYFYADGAEKVFMGSADWMPRNLDRRVEIVFPLKQENTKADAMHILKVQLADNVKARIMDADGKYEKQDRRGKRPICAQDQFCEEARLTQVLEKQVVENTRVFIPAEPMKEENGE